MSICKIHSFQELATKGKAGFYEGRIAEAVVESIRAGGGVMTLDDLKRHNSTMEDPICTSFRGIKVWECPPNGQGITTLLTLNILEELDLDGRYSGWFRILRYYNDIIINIMIL